MGWYGEQVVPRVGNRLMDTPTVHAVRERVCVDALGDVLELGGGSGLNLGHLPPQVTSLHVVEPSAVSLRLARRRVQDSRVPVRHAGTDAQRLDQPDGSFDTVLTTFTLCTIPDPVAALREARRVLRPGGRLVFAEHGLAPDADVVTWQRRLEPVQKRLSGGCHLTRPIDRLLEASGFVLERISAAYLPKAAKPLGYVYEGLARPAG